MTSRRVFASLTAALMAAAALAGGILPPAAWAQAAEASKPVAPASAPAPQGSTQDTGPAITAAPKGNTASTAGTAVAVSAASDRWAESLAAFAAADQAHPPTPGGVLFVGSSSIRLWNGLETEFQSLPVVVKRGFGGSRMLDCARHLHQLVEPYKPRLVLVYAGDNDLAEGRTPEQVLQAFSTFVEGVRQSLPTTRIAYISIKPSPSRVALMPGIRQANDLIRAYTLKTRNTDFIDIYTPMLDAAGQPRPELFRDDLLHLNTQGYALWKRIITAHLN